MDEMRSFVRDKSQQRWLLRAIDRKTGAPLAFCFGSRESDNLDRLLAAEAVQRDEGACGRDPRLRVAHSRGGPGGRKAGDAEDRAPASVAARLALKARA